MRRRTLALLPFALLAAVAVAGEPVAPNAELAAQHYEKLLELPQDAASRAETLRRLADLQLQIDEQGGGTLAQSEARQRRAIQLYSAVLTEHPTAPNNDRVLYFQNTPRQGARSFGVGLRGRAGNPTAIGARLELTLSDGTAQVYEKGSGVVYFGYPEGNLPARLKIRWPDGRVSEHTFPQRPAKLITFSAP